MATLYGTDNNDKLGNTPNALDADLMYGKKGDDVYYVNNVGDRVYENANEGIDTVVSAIKYFALGTNVEHLTLTGIAETGIGNALNNHLYGNSANNRLDGKEGNDTLRGHAGDDVMRGDNGNDLIEGGIGNDQLSGGQGVDTLIGGLGNDIYFIDVDPDAIQELAGQGTDTVVSAIPSFTLNNNLEHLYLRDNAVSGTGNALNNRLYGDAIANTLNGLAGNDTLRGYAGNDTLYGGDGNDILEGGNGADILFGGTGKDSYYLAETSRSVDRVVIGGNIATDFPDNYVGNTDMVYGFVLNEDKLDLPSKTIAADRPTLTAGYDGSSGDGLNGVFTYHTVKNGIYTFYDEQQNEVTVTSANEKQAYHYLSEVLPINVAGGMHVTRADGSIDTIVMEYAYFGSATNSLAVNMVGVNADSLAGWII
jgi:Ca2+-binding RTX toxin-like protein